MATRTATGHCLLHLQLEQETLEERSDRSPLAGLVALGKLERRRAEARRRAWVGATGHERLGGGCVALASGKVEGRLPEVRARVDVRTSVTPRERVRGPPPRLGR